MKKILGIAAGTLVVLVLIGSFVVYPAVAASTARDQIIDGIATIAKASGVRVSGVSVDVDGGNGISAATGGNKVGDISVRIGRVELEEGAASGAVPALTEGQLKESADGARDVLDAIEDVGTVKLTVGDVVSGKDTLPLNDSSFAFSEDAWDLTLRVPKKSVEELLEPLGVDLDITAEGGTISGKIGLGELPAQKFALKVEPQKNGRDIAITLDGNRAMSQIPPDRGFTLRRVDFSTADGAYTVAVGGTYDFEPLRRQIESELDKAENDGFSP